MSASFDLVSFGILGCCVFGVILYALINRRRK